MESIIDINEIKTIESHQLSDDCEVEISDEIVDESLDRTQSKGFFFLTKKLLKDISNMLSKLSCQRNDPLTAGERLLQNKWYNVVNIALFYLCLFFGFCAIINFIVDQNDSAWIYTLFFFTFFLSAMIA